MSQEKVDYKKQQKANRKKINRQKKIRNVLGIFIGVIICAAVVGWIGYSVHTKRQEALLAEGLPKTPVDLSAISDFETALASGEDLTSIGEEDADAEDDVLSEEDADDAELSGDGEAESVQDTEETDDAADDTDGTSEDGETTDDADAESEG